MANWVLILAAGESKRFNGIKALAQWNDGTLLSQAIQTARKTGSNIMVVTGAHHEAIAATLDVPFIFNPNWQDGMGRSLAIGVEAILEQDELASMITVLPVDQPFVTHDHLTALTAAARQSQHCVFTRSDETIGPPASIPKAFYKNALHLNGDRGLKSVLQPNHYQSVDNALALCDIDTQDDWQNLKGINKIKHL